MVTIRKAALDKTIKEIAEEMTISVNDPTRSVDVNFMIDYLQVELFSVMLRITLIGGRAPVNHNQSEHRPSAY